jgi:glutaredoxin-like protein
MAVIQDADKVKIKERLAPLDQPVKLINFTQELECETCRDTRMVMEELAGLSDKLSVQVYNFAIDRDKAKEHRIDKIPGTLIAGEKDYGIRFYGIPSGYEFAALLDDILMVSSRDSGLSEESREKLVGLKSPLHIQVFVTPT